MTSAFLTEVALRSTLLFGVALVAVWTMRRRSAAERHFVLAIALVAGILLPVVFLALPSWAWKVWTAPSRTMLLTMESSSAPASAVLPDVVRPSSPALPAPSFPDIETIMLAILVVGMALQVVRLAAGAFWVRRLRLQSLPADCSRAGIAGLPPVHLSEGTRVAFVSGWLRPVIVLPAESLSWPEDRVRMVLSHELAHVRRRDHWFLPLCGLVRVLYWWNPLAWITLARLRREREQACDDLVIEQFRASDYASLLVDVARVAASPRAQLAMVAKSGVEGRVRAVLDDSLSRNRTPRMTIFTAGLATLLGVCFLGTVRLVATRETRVEFAGRGSVAPKPPGVAALAQADKQVQIEMKLIQLDESASGAGIDEFKSAVESRGGAGDAAIGKFRRAIRAADQAKGLDLMAAPTVTAKFGRKVNVSVVNEFKFPMEFKKGANGKLEPVEMAARNLGLEITIDPMLESGGIVLNVAVRSTELQGFTESEPGVKMPVFNVNETRFVREFGEGGTVGEWMPWLISDEQAVTTEGVAGAAYDIARKRVALVVTAQLVDASTDAATAEKPDGEGASSGSF